MAFETYTNEVIFWELLKKSTSSIYIPIVALLFIGIYRKRLFVPWKSFEQGKKLKLFATAISFILGWIYATYDYNYLFDLWYAWDRILLVLMVVLVYWRPIFIMLFLIVLLPVIGQVELLAGSSIAAPLLPIRILLLFTIFILVKIVKKWFEIRDFIFMLGCLIGAHYFASGIRKIMFGSDWILHDKINYLLPATYANGWMNFASSEWISMATDFLGNFNFPLRLFVLSVECGIIFMFFNLKWMRYYLLGAIAMHLGILFYSGIFFWMWSLILIMTLYFFYNQSATKAYLIFTKKYFILSIVLIGLGHFWCRPVVLTWRDVPFTYTYKIYALSENGKSFQLPPKYFSPYDYQFTLGNFKYLNREKRLSVVWGTAGIKNGSLFNSVSSANTLLDLEKKSGTSFYDEELSRKFTGFMVKFVGNANKKPSKEGIVGYLQPPRLLLTYPSIRIPFENEKIISVEIIETTTLYSEMEGYQEVRNEKILDLPIEIER